MSSKSNAANDFISSIVEKASNDTSFKNQLISDPKKAIETFKGGSLNVPAGKKIVVCDQTSTDTIFINVPPSRSNVELSDEQLEMVAGGWGWIPFVAAPIVYGWWTTR